MAVLYILGGLLLFLFLLTLLPVRIEVAFREEFALTLGYGPLRFPIPLGEEEEESDETSPDSPRKEKRGLSQIKMALRRKGFWGFLQTLADFIGATAKATGRLIGHLKLKHFDLYLCLGGAYDAAQAAVLYGQVSAGVYGGCGVLFTLLPCRKKGVTVDLDYSAAENKVDFEGTMSVRPLFVLTAGLKILWAGVPVIKLFMRKKGT